jgi:signal transduction histidine kinase
VLPAVSELIGWWDSRRLERLVANLVGNALKYSPDEGDVLVTVQCVDDWAVVSVADQGMGIPAGELSSVFDRGYRASNVVGQFPGTGLGLAGACQIVAEHGGTITLESKLGLGTVVSVRLPLHTEVDDHGNSSSPGR